ncbi:MAG: hypothetical protein AAF125_08750 [Chloroflexota bacterium]
MTLPDWKTHYQRERQQLAAQPAVQINLYNTGIITLTQFDETAQTTYPISPTALQQAMSKTASFSTGFIPTDTLYYQIIGTTHTVAAYRPPSTVGLYLEGETEAVVFPLPGLILIHNKHGKNRGHHTLAAVKERPTNLDIELYRAPFPHLDKNGGICWGSVQHIAGDSPLDLRPDWRQLLGSAWGNHHIAERSHREPEDVRKLWRQLHNSQASTFPLNDLIAMNTTLKARLR